MHKHTKKDSSLFLRHTQWDSATVLPTDIYIIFIRRRNDRQNGKIPGEAACASGQLLYSHFHRHTHIDIWNWTTLYSFRCPESECCLLCSLSTRRLFASVVIVLVSTLHNVNAQLLSRQPFRLSSRPYYLSSFYCQRRDINFSLCASSITWTGKNVPKIRNDPRGSIIILPLVKGWNIRLIIRVFLSKIKHHTQLASLEKLR